VNFSGTAIDTGKASFTIHSFGKIGESVYKRLSDAGLGGVVCTSLCKVSGCFEAIPDVLVWILFSGWPEVLAALKGVS
jgi:hypothetical protein